MDMEKALRALKRGTCRLIIDALRTGPKSVAQITTLIEFGVRTNTSQALGLLLDAEIVSKRTDGRLHYYQLCPPALQELSDYIYGVLRDAQLRHESKRLRESRDRKCAD